MAGLLRDDFSPKRPITQVPTAWFNAVAKILNGITAGPGININKNGTDTAGWEFELDLEFARKYLGIEGGGGGVTPKDLTHNDITDWDAATADFLTQGDLDGYATKADVDAVSDLVLDLTDVVDGILLDYVSESDLTNTLSVYSNTETIASTYATKAELSEFDAKLVTLSDYVTSMDADLDALTGYVADMDAEIADISAWQLTGISGTFNVVTSVEWTGTVLRMLRKSVQFTNGLITSIGNDITTTIDTPVLFSQS